MTGASTATTAQGLSAAHRSLLERATAACRLRGSWSAFSDSVTAYPDHERAETAGKAAFEARLGKPFSLEGDDSTAAFIGEEISPYTQAPLGITYRRTDADLLFAHAQTALPAWSRADPDTRLDVLFDVVDSLYARLFEIVHAVQHTTGQSPAMSFAGSGVNALDRAIEALVSSNDAMSLVPSHASWQRSFGTGTVHLDKSYRLVPRGVAVCFACASFPTWNAWPSMMASLATGNAVVVKPHPMAILPMAISVEVFRSALAARGFDPNLIVLAVDTVAEPIGKILVEHESAAIIDFTGGAAFGAWVEGTAAKHKKLCFTETAGINSVVLTDCDDLAPVLRSLATTLSLFSAQMCTSPQNIYIPRSGVRVGGDDAKNAKIVPFIEVAELLAGAVDALVAEPKRAASICSCIQSPATLALLDDVARAVESGQGSARVVRRHAPYAHPTAPRARTSTPLLIACTPDDRALYDGERFGPVSFLIACDSDDDALARAAGDVRTCGGLTAFLYARDEEFIAAAADAYAQAGAQLTINLTGAMPLNFAAAYSDFHVTGLNRAGTATLTDVAFVASRFRIAQSRRMLSPKAGAP